ncbi:MAG: N-acetylmuramic acid 6-phosphate etherase [Rhodobacteraceae bacterium]|nr:N-acetylmuramic acid 6-phosphate etherase [Paracoccaceae bacterium]
MTDTAKTDLIQLALGLQELDSEKTNPASEQLDTLSPLEIATLMNAEDHKIAEAVEKVLPQIGQAIEAAARALRAGGRIIYTGAGTSGRLGVLDAAEVPPTFSAPPDMVIGLIAGGNAAMFKAQEGIEDSAEQGAKDLRMVNVSATDFVVGLAASGRTPYVLGAMREAQEAGAKTAGISCNTHSPLAQLCDIPITPIVGPEILSGSTRLKSGSAQKQILNMISTGAMVKIGKCYGNRMVDLNASNKKLQGRAINLVADLSKSDRKAALAALIATEWNIKAAILMQACGGDLDANAAIKRVEDFGGHLRSAIEASKVLDC